MKKVLGSYYDTTSIKETGLHFGKLPSVIQGADFTDENINETTEEDQWMVEEFNIQR